MTARLDLVDISLLCVDLLVIPEDIAGSNGYDTLVTCYEEGSVELLCPAEKRLVYEDESDGDGPVGGDHPQDVSVAFQQWLLPSSVHPLQLYVAHHRLDCGNTCLEVIMNTCFPFE